jgi:hypothetical protein
VRGIKNLSSQFEYYLLGLGKTYYGLMDLVSISVYRECVLASIVLTATTTQSLERVALDRMFSGVQSAYRNRSDGPTTSSPKDISMFYFSLSLTTHLSVLEEAV